MTRRKSPVKLILILLLLVLGIFVAIKFFNAKHSSTKHTESNIIASPVVPLKPSIRDHSERSSIIPTTKDTPALADVAGIAIPQLDVKSWIIIDMESGQIIAQYNPDLKVAPASLTKLMTSSLVFEAIKDKRISLDQEVIVSERAWKTGGSRMFINVNKKVTIGELLQGMIVQSGNDASIQLAESVSGTIDAFVKEMNDSLQAFHMLNSHFADPTGLPSPNTYTTARDLSVLAQHIIVDFPQFYHYFSQPEFTYNKIRQTNTNGLLGKIEGLDGLKTGHTDEAGYCLVTSVKRNNRRILTILMGADSIKHREQLSKQLIDWTFQNFVNIEWAKANTPFVEHSIRDAKNKKAVFQSTKPVVITVPRGHEANIQVLSNTSNDLKAPLKAGQAFAEAQFALNGKLLKNERLVLAHDVERAGFFKRLLNRITSVF
ncbi:D-alanyl-D-alanine carboxypeptidase family protein [Taylorella equigenitalis]|uniref:serine-type D-Ala-D-Ala carboxypeptidase n=3 Tax=Taylorella equigenitalis TaxID=29575 RepID=A0A654KGT4_TAYEM|nr:D-alanyl-D-alanine carboxypeptidase family protein [Taylorella equigenitalis]ADU91622.1 D-alanyl-D-alanine carboxypeptidase [Taylorella equigenitalis MCE9]AFN35162.1 putative penicillin-binding protein [Taylorella equigenitalis ATCC 35865]ASY29858.1 peptidase [Taylorella equigenitalis]ASY37162.1 D-alanyl-D-alanine carboxypeptidase [Taylorella equigenitalis]ASY38606.1 D-alanyl-D-alanine carboxypeptidase [Taylorella equigenitalis]